MKLLDLDVDPGEEFNVAGKFPEVVNKWKNLYRKPIRKIPTGHCFPVKNNIRTLLSENQPYDKKNYPLLCYYHPFFVRL